MTCDEFEELSGAFALDAVTPAERQAAEEHLATCVKCTTLLQELHGVVALLPLTVPQVKPSATLKERILEAIRQERMVQPAPGQPVPTRQARRPRWNSRTLVAAVLMLSLFSGMIAWNVSLNHQVSVLQQQVVALSHQHNQLPGVTAYSVQGTGQDKGATGKLLYYPEQDITVLIIQGLPQPQGLHVYQGWLLHLKGKDITDVTSVGLLNIQNGRASVSFPGNVTGYDATAISIEPGPIATLKAPKGNVVALGLLKNSTSS